MTQMPSMLPRGGEGQQWGGVWVAEKSCYVLRNVITGYVEKNYVVNFTEKTGSLPPPSPVKYNGLGVYWQGSVTE